MATPVVVRWCEPWLEGRGRNVHSQFGEDGLVETVLERIGETNRYCFEAGAGDGRTLSNTMRMRDAGWRALLVEQDAALFKQAQQYENAAVHCVNAAIGAECKIDSLLSAYGAPPDLDFASIDIDGQDYWVWHEMEQFKPRVVLIEYNFGKDACLIPVRDTTVGKRGGEQATEKAIVELGESKGYKFVARTLCNCLFVRGDL